jgi:hypothetical protein
LGCCARGGESSASAFDGTEGLRDGRDLLWGRFEAPVELAAGSSPISSRDFPRSIIGDGRTLEVAEEAPPVTNPPDPVESMAMSSGSFAGGGGTGWGGDSRCASHLRGAGIGARYLGEVEGNVLKGHFHPGNGWTCPSIARLSIP